MQEQVTALFSKHLQQSALHPLIYLNIEAVCLDLHIKVQSRSTETLLSLPGCLAWLETPSSIHMQRPRPHCFAQNWSWRSRQLCVLLCPKLSCLGKYWFMNCNIYHNTALLHACSNMIHSLGSYGTAQQRSANMSGKPEGEYFGTERRTWSKKPSGAKVHPVHFCLIAVETKIGRKRITQ